MQSLQSEILGETSLLPSTKSVKDFQPAHFSMHIFTVYLFYFYLCASIYNTVGIDFVVGATTFVLGCNTLYVQCDFIALIWLYFELRELNVASKKKGANRTESDKQQTLR